MKLRGVRACWIWVEMSWMRKAAAPGCFDWDELAEAKRIGKKHENMKARTYVVEVSMRKAQENLGRWRRKIRTNLLERTIEGCAGSIGRWKMSTPGEQIYREWDPLWELE